MGRKYFATLIFGLCTIFAIWGQELPGDKETFDIGITEFVGKGLSAPNKYLQKSLPLVIMEHLSICQTHSFSSQELEWYKQYIINRKRLTLLKEREDLYQSKDSFLFSRKDITKEKEALVSKLETLDDKIADLKLLDPVSIEVKSPKPIKFKEYNESMQLFPFPVTPLSLFASLNDLDFVIYGSVEEVEGFLFISISLYSAFQDSVLVEKHDASSPEGVNNKVLDLLGQLKTVLLGRSWGKLTIKTIPDNADIYVDDKYIGSKEAIVPLITVGPHLITVKSEGYKKKSIDLLVTSETDNLFSVELERLPSAPFLITTFPAGADVYDFSRWVGKTPLLFTGTEGTTGITLRKENYRDFKLESFPENGEGFKVKLSPLSLDKNKYIEQKRDQVYTSLGLFVLSVPFPIILYSTSIDYSTGFYSAFDKNNSGETERFYSKSNFCYQAYLGTLIVATSLFANSIVHLVEYLISTQIN